jgi:O-antigen/teichoic acid export membrane protein
MGIIQKQGIANTIISYLGIAIGFFNIIYIQPQLLAAEEVGLLRILFSFSATIAMFLPLGIGNITIKYFPYFKDKDNGHHGTLGLIFLFTFIGALVVGLILIMLKSTFVAFYAKDSSLFIHYFNLVLPIAMSISFCALFSIYCQSLYKSILPTFLNEVALRIFNIIVIVLYYFNFLNLNAMVMLFFSAYTLQAIALLFYIYQIDKPALRINFRKLKEVGYNQILTYGFILSITSITSLSIKYIDVMMLGAYVPLSLVGVYSIAAFIPTVIEAPVNSFEKISNAKVANEWHQNNLDEIFKIYQKSCKYLLFIGGYLFIGIVICAPYLIKLLPNEYHQAGDIVAILAMSSLFNMTTGLNGSLIFTSQGYKFGTFFLLILLVLILMLNYILIPKYGIIGAAIANASASFIYNFLKFVFLWVKFGFQPFTKQTIANSIVILFAVVTLKMLPEFENSFVAIISLGSLITVYYFSICYKLNLIEKELIEKISGTFKKN